MRKRQQGNSGWYLKVVTSRCKVRAAQSAGLGPSAGQSGVGRRGEPHGANDGFGVFLLLVVQGQLPVKGDRFCCKLAQVFGAAVPKPRRGRGHHEKTSTHLRASCSQYWLWLKTTLYLLKWLIRTTTNVNTCANFSIQERKHPLLHFFKELKPWIFVKAD